MDLASVKAVKSFGLCAVDAINGHGGKDAAKTINLTRAGKVKVSGWAVTPDKRSPSSVAVVLLGTEKAYALRADGGRARADVARSVDSEAAGNAGYSAESQLEGVAPGRYAVSILQDSDGAPTVRSEEHTSELQSLMRISYAVFCLKKKKNQHNPRQK